MKKDIHFISAFPGTLFVFLAALLFSACDRNENEENQFPLIDVASGFKVEKVAGGLNFPTGIAWDSENAMYVVEAGGGFLEEPSPARILKVTSGQLTEVVNLEAKGVVAPVVGFTFHNGNFYISHKAADMTGAVSRISKDGASLNQILSGFVDGGSEHPLNDIRMGPDGRMYLATGPAGNSAVQGPDVAPFVSRTPSLRTT
nr:hypothetical protein [Chitinophagaceae bacterium]